ncbi:MAG: penicillin-binding protein 2 [Acidobacteriales bacterium]|nr:penicillin-binding protein 2 [Terriglobales bacterium]
MILAGREEKVAPTKLLIVQYSILFVFLVLLFGLWRLQVMRRAEFSQLAEQNRIRTFPVLAPRGKILDRYGRLIVDNYPSFSALLIRENARDLDLKITKIAQGLNLSEEEIRKALRRYAGRKNEPIILKEDITPDELAFIEANRSEIPELETLMVQRRLYPKDGFAAHLIGYVGEISESDLDRPQFELYNPGDIVGKFGVEQQYNDVLMGKDGYRRSVVDSRGREISRLEQVTPEPGQPLKLTIDLDLQIAAEEALEGHNGAIIAMDPRSGEVLALVSRPTFDPNHFAVRISRDEWNKLITDPAKPLMNKAIQAQLAPGSVFKIIMAVAGMQEGIAEDMQVNCGGGKNFYGRLFKCWIAAKHSAHGIVDIRKAIYQSCDSFFYTLGERLGIGKIAQYAHAFGLGQRTGIDLPQEVSGVMPSEEWKIRNFKQKWYAGETISVSIGQGAVATTPVQLARAIGGIAMGGKIYRPHVVAPSDLPSGFRHVSDDGNGPVIVPIDPKNWEIITDAMADVVSPIGTAGAARIQNVDFAGKTGSAQVVSNDARKKLTGHEFKDNGWFAGVSPRRTPEIVVCALIEQGEHGSLAAQVVSQVIKAFAEKKQKQETKTASVRSEERTVEVGALWSHVSENGESTGLQGGKFRITTGKKAAKKPAVAGD